jgi:TIR domain
MVRGTEEAIHLHEKLLLILSKDAVNSSWVQQEVETALYKEVTSGQEILFSIRLDNTVLESNTLWARRLRQRHIGDFTGWQDDATYQQAFTALLRHLKTAKPPTALS